MSKRDLVRSTVFIRQPKDSTGRSRVWQEKYAVLTSSYWAYYESGAQFNRHREKPVLKISVSSLLEIKALPEMNEGKYAIQITWSNSPADREEMLLGFQDKQQQLKWSSYLEEQTIKQNQCSLETSEESEYEDASMSNCKRDTEDGDRNRNLVPSTPDEDDYDYMPYSPYAQTNVVVPANPTPVPRQRQHTEEVNAKKTKSELLLRDKARSSPQLSEGDRMTEIERSRRAVYSQTEIIKNVGKLKKGMIVYATFAYQAVADDELTFDKGDEIEITRDAGPKEWWCQGRLTGQKTYGLFPINYVDARSQAKLPKDIEEELYVYEKLPKEDFYATSQAELPTTIVKDLNAETPKDIVEDLYVTNQAELPKNISEDIYQAMEVSVSPTEYDHEYQTTHEQDKGSVTMVLMPEELQQGIKDIQRALLNHVETLSRIVAIHDYDEASVTKRIADIDTAQRLHEELRCLSQREERTQKRLDQATSERNLSQSKLKTAEDRIESLQSVLEKALSDNADQGKKLAKLERHQTLLSLRTSEKDELRSFLAEAETLNATLCDQIISLSQEISKTKVAHERALAEKEKLLMAAKLSMTEEKQGKEMLGRQLTVTTKSYSDRLSKAEAEIDQLKKKLGDLDKQTNEKTTELADLHQQLATAKEELVRTTDSERQLGRQLGRLSDDFDAMKQKCEAAVSQTRIAEEQVAAAKQETNQLRESLERATKSQTGPAANSDGDQQDVIKRLQLRVKELEEINSHLEELQVLSETSTSKK